MKPGVNARIWLKPVLASLAALASLHGRACIGEPPRMGPIDHQRVVMVRVADPKHQVAYCPALEQLPGGRLVGTMLTHDARKTAAHEWLVNVFTSDDGGRSWTPRKQLPMVDGQPFVAGKNVYVIGGREDLFISRSADGTEWSDLVPLKTGRLWYSFPGPALRKNGRIYLEKECRTEPVKHGFPVWILAPVVMSARLDADLTRPEAWTYSNALSYRQAEARYGKPNLLGVPFYGPRVRGAPAVGWGEGNLVEIHDPTHVWHDPRGQTLHIFLRAETGRSGLAGLAKAVIGTDGRITVDLERAPSGEPVLFVPLPGGQGAFNILYDARSRLYLLVSSQSTDSMRRVDALGAWHYGLPANERSRVALYFSKNCMDWCLAGLVADAGAEKRSFFHGSTVIDGDDLLLLMRESDAEAVNTHNSNLITLYRIRDFRRWLY
jgi:hypothetical protein